MPFVRVAGNPEPEGAVEEWFEGRGGIKLRALRAPALGPKVRGSVILCNGRTEFIEKYFEVIRELQSRGFCVLTMDWRGQGLSGRELANPLKGHLATLDDPATDLFSAMRLYADHLPRPHMIVAHSMGGGIALRALQTHKISVDAALFCAPMWGIQSVRGFLEDFAKFMTNIGQGDKFAPGVETKWKKGEFKKNRITHDKERFARAQGLVIQEPGLQLAGPTLSWVAAAVTAFAEFRQPNTLAHLRMPIMVLSAGQESLVENRSHQYIVSHLPNADLRKVDGAYHEIMMETDALRAQFWAAFDVLADRMAPRAGAQV
jgi:lysophospholipase